MRELIHTNIVSKTALPITTTRYYDMYSIRDKHPRIMVHFCHQPWIIREYVYCRNSTIVWQFAIQEPIVH